MKLPATSSTSWMCLGAVFTAVGVLLGMAINGGRGSDAIDRFGETLLHASSATSGEQFSIASGAVDADAEGVFVMDHLTGSLTCGVLNRRSGRFAAVFATNVTKDLGAAKNPKYQIVTGLVNFNRGTSPVRPGMSVVYVLDSNSGALAAYGIPWQREATATAKPQIGNLQLIDRMRVRD